MMEPVSAGCRMKRFLTVVMIGTVAALVVLAAACSGVFLEGCGPASQSSTPETVSTSAAAPVTTTASPVATTASSSTSSTRVGRPSTTTTIYTHVVQEPTRIVIPSIKADALIVKVGTQRDGNMEVPPFGLAGWFRVGPAPGARGPAVIVGHVDSKKGPDVFYGLSRLKPGNEILVYGKNGDVATFVVDSSELVLKSELPTERIWNDTQEPEIRLITCGGAFDRSTGHYLSNTIVYGHLVR